MTGLLSGTDYKSIVTDATNKINELLSHFTVEEVTDTKEGAKKSYNGPDIGNILNGTANNIQQIVQGDDQQKVSAVQDILSDLMDLFSNLTTNADSKARKDVKAQDKKIEENKKEAENTSIQVSEKVQNILSMCETNATNINTAIEEIQKLGGDEGKVAEAQQKLEEQIAKIEEKKAILSNPDADSEERKQALVEILKASAAISALVAEVNEYKTLITEQNAIVEENAEQISELSSGAADVISEGVAKMQKSLVDAGVLTKDEVKLAVDSAKNTGIGNGQVAAGEVLTNGPQAMLTAPEGAKFIISGNDKINAGRTLMGGATQGFAKLTNSIGEMGQYLTLFTEFGNGLGSFVGGVADLVGAYDLTVNPMIDSIGSWDAYAEGSKQLNEYTQQYAQKVLDEDASANDSNVDGTQFIASEKEQIEAGDIENKDSKKMKFEEFTFDVRSTFGL